MREKIVKRDRGTRAYPTKKIVNQRLIRHTQDVPELTSAVRVEYEILKHTRLISSYSKKTNVSLYE